jgi:putative hydrolase of the HAD superfamily
MQTWATVIDYGMSRQWIRKGTRAILKSVAFRFELLSNPVWPMPDMKKIIYQLHDRDYKLGIVSNAQSYTPVIMNFFIHNQVEDLKTEIEPFRKDLTIYSYEHRRAKPDVTLFYLLGEHLRRQYNIESSEAVYVGNDMLNDIYTATKAGFRTVLFAGDQRSLRMREGHELVSGISPDFIITDLMQLAEILN